MKIYNTNKEVLKDVKDGVLKIYDNVRFHCNVEIDANIIALDIQGHDIIAKNISAENISAKKINAENISYLAFCVAYQSLKCKAIEGRRLNSFYKCLDSEVIFKPEITTMTKEEAEKEYGIKIEG